MSGRYRAGQTWSEQGSVAHRNKQREQQQERTRSLIAAMAGRGPDAAPHPEIPALPKPSEEDIKSIAEALTYGRTQAGAETLVAADAVALLEILRTATRDRKDRVLLAWPGKPDNGFVAAALYLLEGRARGWHAHATLAVWPWRHATTWTSGSIFVEPQNLVACAKVAAEGIAKKASWTKVPVDHDALSLVHLRLRDLVNQDTVATAAATYKVRRPSLRELTSVFPPDHTAGQAPYQSQPTQILERVRTHTRIKQMGPSGEKHLQSLSNPAKAPLAIFGLPVEQEAGLKRRLSFDRFTKVGLDVIIADLTRTAIAEIGDKWPQALGHLVRAVHAMNLPRPSVVVVTEDVFVMRKAELVLNEIAQAARVQGKPYLTEGLLLRHPGFLAPPQVPAVPTSPILFRADIKDGSLLGLRDEVLAAAKEMLQAGAPEAAAGLRSALSFVRLIANLPLGYTEAKAAITELYDTEDDRSLRVRAKFFLDGALSGLAQAILVTPAHRATLRRVYDRVCATVAQWEAATPISLKLEELIKLDSGSRNKTLLVLPDRHVVDLFLASNLAVGCSWNVSAAKTMIEAARASGARRWIIVRPATDSLKAVITTDLSPERIDILGDAAGTALLAAEIAPMSKLPAFAVYATRTVALLGAVSRSGSDLRADEAELMLPLPTPTRELDFTQAGDVYTGPVVKLTTERGHALLYRPNSDVLRHTADELRAFERVEAQRISEGDHVLVLTETLMGALRQELANSPKTVETLRQYHKEVALRGAALPEKSRIDKARHVVRLIRSRDASFDQDEIQNVCRWLDVDETTVNDPGAQPQAPGTKLRFDLFADALGMPKALSTVYWDYGVRATRSYRVREGLLFHQRAVQFVVEPESFMARNMDRDLRPLWQSIIDSADVVTSKELIRAR